MTFRKSVPWYGGIRWSRRRFVQELAVGGAFAGLDLHTGSAVASNPPTAGSPQTLRGNRFDLDSGYKTVTGTPRNAMSVNGSISAPILSRRPGRMVRRTGSSVRLSHFAPVLARAEPFLVCRIGGLAMNTVFKRASQLQWRASHSTSAVVAVLFSLLAACAGQPELPAVDAGHPASPLAQQAPLPPASTTLEIQGGEAAVPSAGPAPDPHQHHQHHGHH